VRTVNSVDEAWDVLRAGRKHRVIGSNNVNEHSSRSHWLVTILGIQSIFFSFVDYLLVISSNVSSLQYDVHHGEG